MWWLLAETRVRCKLQCFTWDKTLMQVKIQNSSSFSDVSSCVAISLNLLWKCLSADFIWELENQPVWRDMKVKFGCSDNSHFCLICKLCTSAEKWNSVIVKRKEYSTFMLMVKSFKKHCTRDWRETLLK